MLSALSEQYPRPTTMENCDFREVRAELLQAEGCRFRPVLGVQTVPSGMALVGYWRVAVGKERG